MNISFLIAVYNRLDLTQACLESLEATIPKAIQYEVIFVDDGSTDGTRDFLKELAAQPRSRVKAVFNSQRRGYGANNNIAARLAKGKLLCLLNNDMVLTPGWFEPMWELFRYEKKLRIGCVGNVQREPASGLIDHIGIIFNRNGVPIHAGKDTAELPESAYTRWPAATAACWFVSRKTFLELGGFDEQFHNGYEDIDFCLRAGERGLRHYVANHSCIYHYISSSPGRKQNQTEAANFQLFRERWLTKILPWRRRCFRRLKEHIRSSGSIVSYKSIKETFYTIQRWNEKVIDLHMDGSRYLRKHRFRPWKYNFQRLCKALEQVFQPRLHTWPNYPESGLFFISKFSTQIRWQMLDAKTPAGAVDLPPGGFVVFELVDKFAHFKRRRLEDEFPDIILPQTQ